MGELVSVSISLTRTHLKIRYGIIFRYILYSNSAKMASLSTSGTIK